MVGWINIRKVFDKAALAYAGLAAVLLGPLLLPGYVLTLDMVFTPELRLPPDVTGSYPLGVLLYVLGWMVPADVVQKLVLLATLFFAGYGMHRLVRYLASSGKQPGIGKQPAAVPYFAGILYLANPFTYERFMAGQYNVLMGYAVLPWLLKVLLGFSRGPSWANTFKLAGLIVAAGIVSVHALGAVAVLVAAVLGFVWWRQRSQPGWAGKIVRRLGVVALVWVVASSYWLVPAVLGTGAQVQQINTFTVADRQAFATSGDSVLAQAGYVLRLQGFWTERHGMYILPQHGMPVWLWLAALSAVLALVVAGAYVWWRQGRRGDVLLFGTIILAGVVLASGTGSNWLVQYVPFFSGYREPHKFAALVALGYAVFAAVGFGGICRWLDGRPKLDILAGIAVPVVLALPFVWTPNFVWAARGQLQAVDYPEGWYGVNGRLRADDDNFKVLFLPWHLYMYTDYAGRVIANPAPKFFDKPVVVSDDPELRGAALDKSSPAQRRIDAALKSAKSSGEPLAPTLTDLDIKYVMLAKDSDYGQYKYLSLQTELIIVTEDKDIILYRNQTYRR